MKMMRSGLGVAVLSMAAVAGGYFGGRPLLEKIEFSRAEADVQNTRQELSTIEDLSTVFRHVGKVVEPSVVEIQVYKTVKESRLGMGDDQLRKFFGEHGMPDMPGFGNNNDDNGDNAAPEQREEGTGSGVIMDADGTYGYVLTNNHVAGGNSVIEQVKLADGRILHKEDCKLMGADPKSDLAVIQIKADRLIPAHWGNSDDLEKGDWVMAFGAPFGYVGSMTHGIVSALNRNDITGSQDYENFIQVDAPINPGNSGGPLVNIHGEVIGINTAIATVSGGFQGIGFAIPSNSAHTVYGSLKDHGKVVRGWLGIGIASVADNEDIAKSFGYQGTTGVLVQETFPTSPAAGKLMNGDIITKVNGNVVNDVTQLRDQIADTPPNTAVALHIFRDNKEMDVSVTLGNQPEDLEAVASGANSDDNGGANQEDETPTVMGMTLKTLDADAAQALGLTDLKEGAVIMDVANDSAAAESGLQKGDVITQVGRIPVHSASQAADLIKKRTENGGGVRLYVVTKLGSQFVFLRSDSDK